MNRFAAVSHVFNALVFKKRNQLIPSVEILNLIQEVESLVSEVPLDTSNTCTSEGFANIVRQAFEALPADLTLTRGRWLATLAFAVVVARKAGYRGEQIMIELEMKRISVVDDEPTLIVYVMPFLELALEIMLVYLVVKKISS